MISNPELLLRLLVAAFLGGIIGFERGYYGKAAGFRTHSLVCIGSALVMILSLQMSEFSGGKTPVDPSRIAANVVTGIGFLGAGTIIRYGSDVRGLTTAASLWVVAGIGLVVGSGHYVTAFFSTLIVFTVLFFFSKLERKMMRKLSSAGDKDEDEENEEEEG